MCSVRLVERRASRASVNTCRRSTGELVGERVERLTTLSSDSVVVRATSVVVASCAVVVLVVSHYFVVVVVVEL